ncbi:MAG: sulfatase [Actinomycetota bacterium]
MPANVLLVVFDTARADAFEPYGAPPGTTPVVADLARRGVAFPRAIATSNWTAPSHASMFTGLLPRAFGLAGGVPDRAAYRDRFFGLFGTHRTRVLAEVFREQGYATLGVSANAGWITPAFGFDTGFERFTVVHGDRRRDVGRLGAKVQWWRSRVDDGAAAAAAALREALTARDGRPFFAFVNLMECHSPYLPPRPYSGLGPVARWRAVEESMRYLSNRAESLRVNAGEVRLEPDTFSRWRRQYAAAVRMVDDWLGRTLEALDRDGVLQDTVVVVTSDHGENLGEGGRIGHELSMDQRLLAVPLVVAGGAPPAAPAVTSLAALPHVIAASAGLGDHPWADVPIEAGVAVAQNEGLGIDTGPGSVASAHGFPAEALRRMSFDASAATDGRFTLHRGGGLPEALRDLHADPLEEHDAAGAHPEAAARLRGELDRADAALPATARPEGLAPTEEADIERHLEALGYL